MHLFAFTVIESGFYLEGGGESRVVGRHVFWTTKYAELLIYLFKWYHFFASRMMPNEIIHNYPGYCMTFSVTSLIRERAVLLNTYKYI